MKQLNLFMNCATGTAGDAGELVRCEQSAPTQRHAKSFQSGTLARLGLAAPSPSVAGTPALGLPGTPASRLILIRFGCGCEFLTLERPLIRANHQKRLTQQ